MSVVWTYMQQYEFEKALKYAKIADKKYTQYGNKIFEIGLIVKENNRGIQHMDIRGN